MIVAAIRWKTQRHWSLPAGLLPQGCREKETIRFRHEEGVIHLGLEPFRCHPIYPMIEDAAGNNEAQASKQQDLSVVSTCFDPNRPIWSSLLLSRGRKVYDRPPIRNWWQNHKLCAARHIKTHQKNQLIILYTNHELQCKRERNIQYIMSHKYVYTVKQ